MKPTFPAREEKVPKDSTNQPIQEGMRVRFRGEEYTIKAFRHGEGRFGSAAIEFVEEVHTIEVPDEISVDRLP